MIAGPLKNFNPGGNCLPKHDRGTQKLIHVPAQ